MADSDRIVAAVSRPAKLYADANRAQTNLLVTVGPLLLMMLLLGAVGRRRLSSTNRELQRVARRDHDLADAAAQAARAKGEIPGHDEP